MEQREASGQTPWSGQRGSALARVCWAAISSIGHSLNCKNTPAIPGWHKAAGSSAARIERIFAHYQSAEFAESSSTFRCHFFERTTAWRFCPCAVQSPDELRTQSNGLRNLVLHLNRALPSQRNLHPTNAKQCRQRCRSYRASKRVGPEKLHRQLPIDLRPFARFNVSDGDSPNCLR